MPTTSLTHPKMFDYLVTSSKKEDYNFQHMISLKAIVLFSTPSELAYVRGSDILGPAREFFAG